MTATASATPLLSRPVAVDDIPSSGLRIAVATTGAERAAIATFNSLVGMPALSADLLLRHEGMAGVHVTGSVIATVTQTCVVSLEAFDAPLKEAVDVHFLSADALAAYRAARLKRTQAADDDEDEEGDEPDLVEHGRIDLGTLVAEFVTLGIDPYPRKPDAALDPRATADEPRSSPFAVLRDRDEDLA